MLADVEARSAAGLGTFEVLPRTVREGLRVGDLAKVVVVAVGDQSCAERIWVQVTAAPGPSSPYRGRIVSFPVTQNLFSGDVLDFGPEHVADCYLDEGTKRVPLAN